MALSVTNYKVKRSFNKGSENSEKFNKSLAEKHKQISYNDVQKVAKSNRSNMAKVTKCSHQVRRTTNNIPVRPEDIVLPSIQS